MSDKDTITLPREVVQEALEALVWEAGSTPEMYAAKTGRAITALRTHLAAPVQPRCDGNHSGPRCDDPECWNDATAPRTALAAEPTKPEPVAYFDLQKQVFYWARPTMIDVPMTVALEPLPLYTAPPEDEALRRDAERYRWLREWLDNNGLLVRAIRGESLAGYEHPDIKALRRDAERYRWLREKDGIAVDVTVFGSMEANLDAAIDAAMKEDKR